MRRGEGGQGTVEFALTFPIVFAMILGLLELGFAGNAYLTLASAAREGARAGAVYLYDSTALPTENDQNRESGTGTSTSYLDNVRSSVEGSLGILKRAPANFDRNSDVTITYSPVVRTSDSRKGDFVQVQVVYRYDFMTGLVAGNSLTLTAKSAARIE